MIYQIPPVLAKQDIICLDVGHKKTGVAHNFQNHNISFAWKVIKTEDVLGELQLYNCKVVIGLPLAYPESESYGFITFFTNFLQEHLPDTDFIFWDETDSSDTIRKAYKSRRGGFSKKFYNNYDARVASLILSDFIACNF